MTAPIKNWREEALAALKRGTSPATVARRYGVKLAEILQLATTGDPTPEEQS